MTKSELKEKRIRLLNQAEQVRQRFLPKGLDVANKARDIFLKTKDGRRYSSIRNYTKYIYEG